MLMGAAAHITRVAITDQTETKGSLDPADARAGYRLLNTGSAESGTGEGSISYSAISGEWLVSGSASGYDVRATLNSGSLDTGTTGSWLNLGTSRAWTVVVTEVGSQSANLTIEIRPAGGGATLASATVTLNCTVSA